ncbi:T9SS type A sorting domain-containing protein [Mariniflexile sp. AS56]|uniref:T9SS type A sorting domain-containing protein n=1 Tax=Mariniflexile sp. AS56 TaxID=3063957 RepID=UPI0026F0704E|nr:T9SS type A sorting domain-containing protein [Mariniflexile sp. AS56]MDO7173630.1 T9SS type A sorting domain-containing protein [Mariniflexile sp. AS56]
MKQVLIYTCILLFSFYGTAQTISSAEYFFNTDPGVGNGVILAVNSNTGQLIQTFSIPITSLTDGFNSLYVRTFNSSGKWSLYDRERFYIKRFITTNITSAEYFYNTDPGIGNGTALTVNSNTGQLTQTYSIPITGLADGLNNLYVRTLSSNGDWSLFDRQHFYIKNFNSVDVTAAEYFYNLDPGIGNGTGLAVDANSGQLTQTFSIPVTGLTEGFHSFYLRTQSSSGKWSLYDRQIIYIKDFDFSPDEVSNAEYFIDSDPGVGNGTAVVFGNPSEKSQVLSVNSAGLAEGDHVFYIRVRDTSGDWSIYDTALFKIDGSLGVDESFFKSTIIHPNPFLNTIELSSSLNIPFEKAFIYDFNGRKVFESTSNLNKIDLGFLSSGVYILHLNSHNRSASFKIVKE